MTLLILGLAVWWVTHLLAIWAPDRRAALDQAAGAIPARVGLGLVSILAVVMMVIGYQDAEYVEIWLPPAFLVHVNNLLMVFAILLMTAGGMKSPVRRRIRHPQLTAVKVWALAHIVVNGDLASVILFGGMMAWAVVAVIGSNRRDGPRGALPEATAQGLVIHLMVTVVVFGVVTFAHGWLGVRPFPG